MEGRELGGSADYFLEYMHACNQMKIAPPGHSFYKFKLPILLPPPHHER